MVWHDPVGDNDPPPKRQNAQIRLKVRTGDTNHGRMAQCSAGLPDFLDISPCAVWIVGRDEIENLIQVALRLLGVKQRQRHGFRCFSASASRVSKY